MIANAQVPDPEQVEADGHVAAIELTPATVIAIQAHCRNRPKAATTYTPLGPSPVNKSSDDVHAGTATVVLLKSDKGSRASADGNRYAREQSDRPARRRPH